MKEPEMKMKQRSVTVSLGYTMNLGNFESLRMDFGVTDSVREGELIEEALDRVQKIVEDRLVQRINEERGHG